MPGNRLPGIIFLYSRIGSFPQAFSVGDLPLLHGTALASAKSMSKQLSLDRIVLTLLLLLAPLWATSLPAADGAITDPELIRKAAARAVLERLDVAKGVADVTVDNLDSRLRLPACSQALSGFIAGDGNFAITRR